MSDRLHDNRWISWKSSRSLSSSVTHTKLRVLFFQIVPWLNAFVIVGLCIVLSKRIVVSPAVQFKLPAAQFSEGAETGASLVMLRPDVNANDTLVFFDGVRYRVGSDDETKLSQHLSRYARNYNDARILLLAERNVLHGDVISMVNLARKAGITTVNVAVKPE